MTRPGFIEAGLEAVRGALQAAADRAGLTLRHYEITRAAARRFRAQVRLLETLLRRLLVLMAASLDAVPARTASATSPLTPAKAGASGRTDDRSAQPPKTPRYRGFALLPPATYDAARFALLRARPRATPTPPEIGPLLDRYRTLIGHLAHPDRLARRMARHLARLKRAGEPRPVCLPMDGLHRLSPALGLIAAALPAEVSAALATWYDTG